MNPLVKHPERVLVKTFKTPKFKLRKEAFGGVFAFGRAHVFMDSKGFDVLKQLKPDTVYNLATMAIDWKGLDPEKFVSGLAYRNAVLAV